MGGVEDTASSRRAKWNPGDVAFSLCTAVLGCALLFAAGQHLFGPTADGIPQPSAAYTGQVAARAVATALAVPLASNVTVTPAFVRRSAPADHAPQQAQRGRQAPHRTGGSSPTRENARNGISRKLAVASPLLPASPIAAVSNRLRNGYDTAKRTVAHHARHVPAGHSARTAPATRAARPASGTAGSIPHRAERRNIVTRATFDPAKTRLVAQAPRLADHVRAKRQRAIIEPPLGYEAQPALVVAPAAAALDLGAPALPSIRSRRHH